MVTKAQLRVQFLPALGGREWERGKAEASSSALLSEKGAGREGSIESQQKFGFFCSNIMPKSQLKNQPPSAIRVKRQFMINTYKTKSILII